jgi:hypothetical protein
MVFLGRKVREGVMIHHLSIAARDPKHAAGVLAELMGGTAVPFPPNPGSFFALQLDDHGSGVEVYPAGTELAPNGSDGGSFVKNSEAGRGSAPPILPSVSRPIRRPSKRLLGAPAGNALCATGDPFT